jgi:hypothetical protein
LASSRHPRFTAGASERFTAAAADSFSADPAFRAGRATWLRARAAALATRRNRRATFTGVAGLTLARPKSRAVVQAKLGTGALVLADARFGCLRRTHDPAARDACAAASTAVSRRRALPRATRWTCPSAAARVRERRLTIAAAAKSKERRRQSEE